MKSNTIHIFLLSAAILFLSSSCNPNNTQKKEIDEKASTDQTNSKLLLLSKGLTTDTLKHEFLNLLKKEPSLHSVAVVANASSTEKKMHKKTKKVKVEFAELGFDSTKIVLFDLLKTPANQLEQFDIIYILGGNPFKLLDVVHKSGAGATLKNLMHQEKILMGYSAGALLLGPDLSQMDYVDSLLGFNEIDLKELSCIGLYDFYIFPHYKDFTSQVPELSAKIEEFESSTNRPLYRLNDNQGILYQNGAVKIIGT